MKNKYKTGKITEYLIEHGRQITSINDAIEETNDLMVGGGAVFPVSLKEKSVVANYRVVSKSMQIHFKIKLGLFYGSLG